MGPHAFGHTAYFIICLKQNTESCLCGLWDEGLSRNCSCINELLQENKKVFSDDQHGFGTPPSCFLPWSPKSPIHSMCCIFNAWNAMVFFLFIKGENPTQTRYGGNALWPCGCTKMSSHSRKNEINSVVMCFIQSHIQHIPFLTIHLLGKPLWKG